MKSKEIQITLDPDCEEDFALINHLSKFKSGRGFQARSIEIRRLMFAGLFGNIVQGKGNPKSVFQRDDSINPIFSSNQKSAPDVVIFPTSTLNKTLEPLLKSDALENTSVNTVAEKENHAEISFVKTTSALQISPVPTKNLVDISQPKDEAQKEADAKAQTQADIQASFFGLQEQVQEI